MANDNFTRELKKEIIKKGLGNACCKTAALSAFLRTTGSIVRNGSAIGFEFVSESENVAEFFIGLLEDLFGAELKIVQAVTDNRNGRNRLVFQCLSEESPYILSELGIISRAGDDILLNFGIDKYLIENDCCRRAFIKGAFLGSGSCMVPRLNDARSGYHLEIVFTNKTLADEFLILLEEYEILAKCIDRKGGRVVYLKSRESISDFLYFLGAESSCEKLDELADRKDEKNRINRVANCLQKNYDKTALASVNQVRAIELISESIGLQELEPALQETAKARIGDKEASLRELALRLNISKSCLNHRLRKLLKIAEEIKGGS